MIFFFPTFFNFFSKFQFPQKNSRSRCGAIVGAQLLAAGLCHAWQCTCPVANAAQMLERC